MPKYIAVNDDYGTRFYLTKKGNEFAWVVNKACAITFVYEEDAAMAIRRNRKQGLYQNAKVIELDDPLYHAMDTFTKIYTLTFRDGIDSNGQIRTLCKKFMDNYENKVPY